MAFASRASKNYIYKKLGLFKNMWEKIPAVKYSRMYEKRMDPEELKKIKDAGFVEKTEMLYGAYKQGRENKRKIREHIKKNKR